MRLGARVYVIERGKKKKKKNLRDARRAVFSTKQRGDKNTDHL